MLERLLERKRLVIASSLFLALVGIFAWGFMPREEDPRMPERFGMVIIPFPGADVEQVERLVLDPVEEHLGEVDEIKTVESRIRANVAILNIELGDQETDTDAAWDEIERTLQAARRELPDGVLDHELDRELLRTESVVLAVTGSHDRLELAEAAERIKKQLLQLPEVAQVVLTADPGEQVTVEYDDVVARRFDLDPRMLLAELAARNSAVPGGAIKVGERTAVLRPKSEFESVAEIRTTPVPLPAGGTIALGDVASVKRTVQEPTSARMRLNGKTAVGVGIIPREKANLVEFGRAVRQKLGEIRPEHEPFQIEEMIFQPDRVETRLGELGTSLLIGVLIVAGVLIGFMGFRLGALVASVVPLVALSSLGLFAIGGGLLHQISIAALVLALGMLVDNAIVVAESVQRQIDEGVDHTDAVRNTVRKLAVPLAAATGTTLAAFVPMLLSKGPTGDFTRSIPIVLMLSLTVSYVFAILVTPVMSGMFLRPSRERGVGWFDRISERLGRVAVERRRWIFLGAAGLVGASGALAGDVEKQFFPAGDRNQLVVSVELPEGSHLDETDERSRRVEAALAAHPKVRSVAAFVGRSTPRFYYNLLRRPSSPHLSQLLVTTADTAAVEEVAQWARNHVRAEHPELEVVARRLEQGPPVNAPIEIRLLGDDLEKLALAADQVLAVVRSVDGTRDVRHTMGVGVPSIRFAVDDSAAGRYGLARDDVAVATLGRTRGLEIGQLRTSDDPIPIVMRSTAGEYLEASALESIDVTRPGRPPVPLGQVARASVDWQPAVIEHYQRSRSVRVLAELADGVPYSRALEELRPKLAALDLPAGVSTSYGGAEEGSGQANTALLSSVPLGIFLLLFILLAEFNSFRRLAIILATVPLAATGIVPGLLLSGQPFGFMSMLGVFALVGIVVNNAIVLLDVADRSRAGGATVASALQDAVKTRTRPILLTTVTTVAGLLPLALSNTTLWPPLAWAMISGLMASTLLTLLVVPALYGILIRDVKAPA